jgi:hypothetical protein
LLFLRNNTVCEAGNLLYLGIDGLIPGGGYTQFFGHPDELREGFGPHLVHDLTAVDLIRNSTAPAFMACTVIGMSPWPAGWC